MYKFLVAIFLMMSLTSTALANCRMIFKKPRGGAMSATYITNKTYGKIIDILTAKGYDVFSPGEISEADFYLDVRGYYGHGCGTGLSFGDYLVVPAHNSIHFKSADLQISKEKAFASPLGVRSIAKRHLMKTIKNLPNCQ
jgi:hypothetical protein